VRFSILLSKKEVHGYLLLYSMKNPGRSRKRPSEFCSARTRSPFYRSRDYLFPRGTRHRPLRELRDSAKRRPGGDFSHLSQRNGMGRGVGQK